MCEKKVSKELEIVGENCEICTIEYDPILPEERLIDEVLIMIIGRDPGNIEVEQRKIFIGKSGRLLRSDISLIGIPKSIIYITNLTKCHTPKNRGPSQFEIQCCSPILEKEIKKYRPRILITLGTEASSYILKRRIAITKDRGYYHLKDSIPEGVVCTYHPSYLLRCGEEERNIFRGDLEFAMNYVSQ